MITLIIRNSEANLSIKFKKIKYFDTRKGENCGGCDK